MKENSYFFLFNVFVKTVEAFLLVGRFMKWAFALKVFWDFGFSQKINEINLLRETLKMIFHIFFSSRISQNQNLMDSFYLNEVSSLLRSQACLID